MRISVVPWGNPRSWRLAKYVYENSSVEGFSTLELLLSSKDLTPDNVLLCVLDTLAAEALSGNQIPSRYESLINHVREYVKKFVCSNGRIHIEVFPGVLGQRGGSNFEFRTDLNATKLLILYKVYFKILESAGGCGDEELEILLDTTHGINYFTVLVREAVFEAVSMVSTALAKTITLRVFNADPAPRGGPVRSNDNPCVPKGGDTVPVLNYNLLSENKIEPWSLIGYLKYRTGRTDKILSDIRDCNINEDELKSTLMDARRTVASFRVGALFELIDLVLSNRCWSDTAEKLIKGAHLCWLRKVRIEKGCEVTRVLFNTNIMDGFKLLLHAHAIHTGMKRSLGIYQELNMKGSRQCEDGVSLKVIEGVAKKFLKGSEVTSTLVENELGAIESMREKKLIPNDWKLYADIYGEVKPEATAHGKEQFDIRKLKRNFIAHTGLLKDLVELKANNGDVAIRIRGCNRELINKILDEIFKELVTQ